MRTSSSSSSFARTAWVLLLALSVSAACNTRAAEKLIDPRLHAEGEALDREGRGRNVILGRYRVEALTRREQPFDGSGPLAAEADGRTRPTQQIDTSFRLVGGARPWQVRCVGHHRQPSDHDLAAAIDELRDEVALRCEIEADARAGGGSGDGDGDGPDLGERWTLAVHGDLTGNLLGSLTRAARPGRPNARRDVEILMWHRLWNISRRRLPASLVTVRSLDGEQTDAAMIMAPREQAYLAPELEPAGRELALAAMLAVRLMPLGFDL